MDIAQRIAEILEAVRNGSLSQADADAAIASLRQQDPSAMASATPPARAPLADLLGAAPDAKTQVSYRTATNTLPSFDIGTRTLPDMPVDKTTVDIPTRLGARPAESLTDYFSDMPPRTEVDIPTRANAMGTAMPRAGGSALRRALGAVGKKLPYIGGALGVADAMFSDKPVPLALFDMIAGEPDTSLAPDTLPPRVDAPMFDPSSPTSQTPVKPSAVRDFNVVAGVQPKRDSAASFSPSLRDMIMGGGAPMTVEPSVPEFDPRSALAGAAENAIPALTESDMPTVADVDFPEYATRVGKYEGRSASTGGALSSESDLDALLARLKLLQSEQSVSPLRQRMSPRESFRDYYSGGGMQ